MRSSTVLAGLLVVVVALVGCPAALGAVSTPPACAPATATNEPALSHTEPPPGPVYFAPDFPQLNDDQWGFPLGGFGGLARGGTLHHTPVVFVHGNQADAQNWLDVMQQFQNDAGYSMQEMYALSYNGLGNYYAGLPLLTPPSAADRNYVTQNPAALDNGGHGGADDDEVPDLCRFIEAVQRYTGSRQIDIVAHSLGVTVARKLMFDYPDLARDVVAFVGIAGANHGTTVCRGMETTYYGCNEIAPGSPWLAQLNGPDGSLETYPPTRWMTVYDGFEGDPFYVGPDAPSPALQGADNRTFPGAYHNDLRVDPAEVDTYLAFLLGHGQAGVGADPTGAADAARLARRQPDGLSGPGLRGIPLRSRSARRGHRPGGPDLAARALSNESTRARPVRLP